MRWLIVFLLLSCVLPVLAYTDEPAAVADWQTLLRRIETL